MKALKWIYLYFFIALVFFALDYLWLGVIAQSLYQTHLGHLLAPKPLIGAAALFYSIYLLGLIYFGIYQSWLHQKMSSALINGSLYGFFCYTTYELTNWAMLKDWPVSIVLPDILWGVFLNGSVAVCGFLFLQKLSKPETASVKQP